MAAVSGDTPPPAVPHEGHGQHAHYEGWSAEAFGRRLVGVRVARRLRCVEVAAAMEVTPARVWAIERSGVGELDVVARYAEALRGRLLQAVWFDDGDLHDLPNTGSALGGRLAQIRHNRRLGQAHLAAQMGLTKGRISHIEQRHVARLDTVARYAAALGGRLLQIISFDDDTAHCLHATTSARRNGESELAPSTRSTSPGGGVVARRDRYSLRADGASGEAR